MRIHALFLLPALGLLLLPSPSLAETTGPEPYSIIYFTSPADATEYPTAPVTIGASIAVEPGSLDVVSTVELFVDEVSFATLECELGCMFTGIELGQGVHVLRAESDTGSIDSRMVYVEEEAPSDTGESDTGEDDTDESDTGESGDGDGDTGESGESAEDTEESGESEDETGHSHAEDDSGKGCSVVATPAPFGLMALSALMLLGLRRRD